MTAERVCVLAVSLLLLSAGVAFGQADISVEDVLSISTGEVQGTSQLVRTDEGLSFSLDTEGLEPGGAYTIWWIVFKVDSSGLLFVVLTNASGGLASPTGHAHFAGHLAAGELPEVDGSKTLLSIGELDDPRGATVRFIIRSHGQKIPGLQQEQTSTFLGGCPPNTCVDVQRSSHVP